MVKAAQLSSAVIVTIVYHYYIMVSHQVTQNSFFLLSSEF